MLGIIFTLDYEIYGSGAGDFDALMIEPTRRLLALFQEFGAKLTIMADVAEILALRRHPDCAKTLVRIETQLGQAIAEGHDVQLHLHPGWFNARRINGHWHLDFSEYALAPLPKDKIADYIRRGKEYLETLGRKERSDYRCLAFRAGNWLMQPSENIVAVLEEAGFLYDTSVFKGGCGSVGPYALDYRSAHSHLESWTVHPEDISRTSDRRGLREIPILTRMVPLPAMLSLKRLQLQWRLRRDSCLKHRSRGKTDLGTGKAATRIRWLYPKKFDFCRLSVREMRSLLEHAIKHCRGKDDITPIVAIGHSTEYTGDHDVRRFLEYVRNEHGSECVWTTFLEYAQRDGAVA